MHVFLRLDAKKNSKNYIDEQIPFEPEKDIVTLKGIKKRAGMALRGGTTYGVVVSQRVQNNKNSKIQLLTNSSIVNEADR